MFHSANLTLNFRCGPPLSGLVRVQNYLQNLADNTIVSKELNFELLKVRIVGNCSTSTLEIMGSSVFCLYSHLLDFATENWQQQSPVAQLVEC